MEIIALNDFCNLYYLATWINKSTVPYLIKGGGRSNHIFWKLLPSIAFNNEPQDYENCNEHLPTHLIFTPSPHDFQPLIHKHKT